MLALVFDVINNILRFIYYMYVYNLLFIVYIDYHAHDDIKQHESVDVDVPQEVKDLEKAGVRQAEEGDLSGALEKLTRVLELVPNYASGYNNRAQVSIVRS